MGEKPNYNNYVEYMESLGWRRSQITLNQNNTKLVTVSSVASGTTGNVIDIKVPAGQKMSVMGTQQVALGNDARTAHSLRVRFASTADVEVSLLTSVRITKEKSVEDVVQLFRGFYLDISYTKQELLAASNATLYKTDMEWYRFKQGIEFNGEEHMIIGVVSENPTGGPILPNVAIDSTHVKFAIDVDFWTS